MKSFLNHYLDGEGKESRWLSWKQYSLKVLTRVVYLEYTMHHQPCTISNISWPFLDPFFWTTFEMCLCPWDSGSCKGSPVLKNDVHIYLQFSEWESVWIIKQSDKIKEWLFHFIALLDCSNWLSLTSWLHKPMISLNQWNLKLYRIIENINFAILSRFWKIGFCVNIICLHVGFLCEEATL